VRPYLTQKKEKKDKNKAKKNRAYSQVVEHLSKKHETLCSNSSTAKKKKKKRTPEPQTADNSIPTLLLEEMVEG
jgi:hypothetical protein